MRNKLLHSKYFMRIFFAVYVAGMLLLTLGMFVLYFSMQRVTMSYLDTVMVRFMDNICTAIDKQCNVSHTNVLNTATSVDSTALLNAKDLTVTEQLQLCRKIDYPISQTPNIHSVVYYDSDRDYVYMFGRELLSCPAAEFYDQAVMEQLRGTATVHTQNQPRVISDSPYNQKNVSVITSYFYLGRGDIMASNLAAEQMFSMLENDPTVYPEGYNSYFVLADDGQVIYSSYYYKVLAQYESDFAPLLEKHRAQECFTDQVGGVSYRFYVSRLSQWPYQVVSVIRSDDVTAGFLRYLLPFLGVALGCSLLAAVLYLAISSRLYAPIDRIKHSLPEQEDITEFDDEIEYITSCLAEHTVKMRTLSSYKAKNLSVSQVTFLKDQLLYSKYDDDTFWEKCRQEELPYQPGDQFVLIYVCWFPVEPHDAETYSDQSMLCFALSNMVHELASVDVFVQPLPFDQSGMAFLFSAPQFSQPPLPRDGMKTMQGVFEKFFRLHVSFFVSEHLSAPSRLAAAMEQMQELSAYHYFYDKGCILRADEVDLYAKRDHVCPSPDVHELESFVRNGEWEAVLRQLDAYFAELPHYTCEAAAASLNVFLLRLITMLKRIESTCSGLAPIPYHQLYTQCSTANTLSQARKLIVQQLESVSQTVSVQVSGSTRIASEDVQRYLAEHYQDYDLSSKSVAEYFRVSVSYLNRIFKQKTGESISSYIKKLRLEQARSLLLSSADPVEVVAKTAGFENTKYFYSLFKTEYGVSPNSYRAASRQPPQSEPQPEEMPGP